MNTWQSKVALHASCVLTTSIVLGAVLAYRYEDGDYLWILRGMIAIFLLAIFTLLFDYIIKIKSISEYMNHRAEENKWFKKKIEILNMSMIVVGSFFGNLVIAPMLKGIFSG